MFNYRCDHIHAHQYLPENCHRLSRGEQDDVEKKYHNTSHATRCPEWPEWVCPCGCKGVPVCPRMPLGRFWLRVAHALGAVLLILAILSVGSCTRIAYVAVPSSEHVALTPAEYAAAEGSFAGAAAPLDEWNDSHCQDLLDKRDALVAVTAGLGGLTGASGLTSVIPVDMEKEKKENLQLGLGITTLVLGATATVFTVWAKNLSSRFEERCLTENKDADPVIYEHPASDEIEMMPLPDELAPDGGV